MNRKLTFNEMLMIAVAFIFLLAFVIPHFFIWRADYQFWKIDGYLKQGQILLTDSSLKVPSQQTGSYCNQITVINSSDTAMPISFAEDQEVFCGCLLPKNKHNITIKYKQFQNKIIYQCENFLLETSIIPASLKDNKA